MKRVAMFFLLVFAPIDARAQEEQAPAEYDGMIERALAESAAGRFEEARVLFRRAHEIFPNARTLRGIGMVAYELRDYPDAIRHLRLAIDEARRPLTEEQRTHARGLIEQALAFVGRYELSEVPEGAGIHVDGRRADREPDGTLLLSVGPHEVVVRSGADVWRGQWTVRGGESEALPIAIEARPVAVEAEVEPARELPEPIEEPAAFDSSGALVLLIGGIGALVLGAGVLGSGILDVITVEQAEPGTDWTSLRGAYDRAPILTGIGSGILAVGAAAALGGGIWLAVGNGGEGARAGLFVRGRF